MNSQSYSGPNSLEAMRRLCIEVRQNGITSDHTGDLNWGAYMHVEMNPARDTRLWWDGDTLAAFAINHKKYGLSAHLAHSQLDNGALFDDMLAWAVAHTREHAVEPVQRIRITSQCAERNVKLMAMFLSRGFIAEEHWMNFMQQSLDRELPALSLEPGVMLRPVLDHEFADRAKIHAEVWHPSKVTLEGYKLTRTAPNYDAQLDIVALMPDRVFGAYCIAWPEPETRSIEFEPVGTREQYRRKGLGHAVMYEAMRRAKARGFTSAFVHCTEDKRDFYESAGFHQADRWIYLKLDM